MPKNLRGNLMSEETTEKPKYVGYGYHGGGRKKGSGTGRKYKTFSFSCSPEEYEQIKQRIEESGLKPSHFFVKKCLE